MVELNQNFAGAKSRADNLQALAIPDKIFSLVGTNPAVIERPDNYRTLVFKVEVGAFRIRVAEITDSLDPPDITDQVSGEGTVSFTPVDGVVVLQAPTLLSLQGQSGSDILTYWWLP